MHVHVYLSQFTFHFYIAKEEDFWHIITIKIQSLQLFRSIDKVNLLLYMYMNVGRYSIHMGILQANHNNIHEHVSEANIYTCTYILIKFVYMYTNTNIFTLHYYTSIDPYTLSGVIRCLLYSPLATCVHRLLEGKKNGVSGKRLLYGNLWI